MTLLITKQVESGKEGYETQPFEFTVNIPSQAGKGEVTAIKYKLDNDNGEKWLPLYNDDGDPVIEPISFNGEGTATFSLTHDEGLMFFCLNDGEVVTVKETLTVDQLKDDYRLENVQDESGSSLEAQFDHSNRSYTVTKTIKTTDNNNDPVLNELHWLNKTFPICERSG